ncbi:6-phosphogluconolactonase [Nowakowskiella sp. JEL0407]|nr:6-phosphogluconolactonase [Nowakowskiella sp. JEL0407]
MARSEVFVFESNSHVSTALNSFVEKLSLAAIASHGRFTVALSGGSLPSILAQELKNNTKIDFSRWHVFYADERCVLHNSPDSNHGLSSQVLLDLVPIPKSQIYPINERFVDSPETAAVDYENVLKSVFVADGTPRFDLILLGMGPDGHTCSLFPGHPLLHENSRLISWLSDSPKPPPSRITFTYPLVNNADAIAFVSTGAGKADVLHEILDNDNQIYPSARVNPTNGKLYWFIDQGAASKLSVAVAEFSL